VNLVRLLTVVTAVSVWLLYYFGFKLSLLSEFGTVALRKKTHSVSIHFCRGVYKALLLERLSQKETQYSMHHASSKFILLISAVKLQNYLRVVKRERQQDDPSELEWVF
jgi:hypothetical protein